MTAPLLGELLPGLLPYLLAFLSLSLLLFRTRHLRGREGVRGLARAVAVALLVGAGVALLAHLAPLGPAGGGEVGGGEVGVPGEDGSPPWIGRFAGYLLTLLLCLVYLGGWIRAMHRLRIPLGGTLALAFFLVGTTLEILAVGGIGPALGAWWRVLLHPTGFVVDAPDLLFRGVSHPSMGGWALTWHLHLALFLLIQGWPTREKAVREPPLPAPAGPAIEPPPKGQGQPPGGEPSPGHSRANGARAGNPSRRG